MKRIVLSALLLIAVSGSSVNALGVGGTVKSVHVVPNGNEVRIEVELTAPATPLVKELANPNRLIVDFPKSAVGDQSQLLKLYRSGVFEIHVSAKASDPSNTRIVAGIDSARQYTVHAFGNKVVVSILPHTAAAGAAAPAINLPVVAATKTPLDVDKIDVTAIKSPMPQIEALSLDSAIEEPQIELVGSVRRTFKVKYISGDTVYLDGGANSGVRAGMELDISRPHPIATSGAPANSQDAFVATVRVIGVAAASAVSELLTQDRAIRVGDVAELTPKDEATAAGNVASASRREPEDVLQPASEETSSPSSPVPPTARNHISSSHGKEPRLSKELGWLGELVLTPARLPALGLLLEPQCKEALLSKAI